MFLVQAPAKIQLSSSNVIWCRENHSHRAFFYHPYISKFLDDQDMHSLLTESYWPHSSDFLNVTCTNVMQSISKHTELHDYIFSSGKHLIKHVWCTSHLINFSTSEHQFPLLINIKIYFSHILYEIWFSKKVSQSSRVFLCFYTLAYNNLSL